MTAPENYTFNAQNLGNYPPGVSAWASVQTPLRQQTFTNPPAADIDAFKTAIATVAAPVTYSGTALNGVVGTASLAYARNITITTAGVTPANAPATATITSVAIDGSVQTETINVGQTATTVVGAKAVLSVTSIALPAADGTAATLAFGFGDILGLDSKLADLGLASAAVLKEVEAGALVTTGTFVAAATSGPYGTYAPATVPNGTNDYALLFVVGA